MAYLSSAPAAGQSHSGLLPSTVAGPRGHRRKTRNYGLQEGKKNAVTLTKGYPRAPGVRTGHLQRVHSAPAAEVLGTGTRGWVEHRAGRDAPRSEIPLRSLPSPRLSTAPSLFPLPSSGPSSHLPGPGNPGAGTAALTSHPPARSGPVTRREMTGRGEGGAPCARPRRLGTWGVPTNGKTDRRGWEESGKERGPKDCEAGRRRKGETRVFRQHSAEGVSPAHAELASWGRRDQDHFSQGAPGASRARWGAGRNCTGQGIHTVCDPRSLPNNRFAGTPLKLSIEAAQAHFHYAWAPRERGLASQGERSNPPPRRNRARSRITNELAGNRPRVEGRGRTR